jgi:hypothetical protein
LLRGKYIAKKERQAESKHSEVCEVSDESSLLPDLRAASPAVKYSSDSLDSSQ